MPRASRLALLLLLLALPAQPAAPRATTATVVPRATCVFVHQAFAGKCTERPEIPEGSTAKQACASVLSCLNDVRCIKTYCQATTLRTDWKLESAK